MIDYLRLGAEALILTIVIEVIVAWLFGLRNKTELLTLILVNVITNPLFNYFFMVNGRFHLISQVNVLTLCLEVGVVLAEWRLLVYVLRRGAKQMLALSAAMNATSFLAGFLILR